MLHVPNYQKKQEFNSAHNINNINENSYDVNYCDLDTNDLTADGL